VQWKAHNAGAAVDTDATMPRLYIFNKTGVLADWGNAA
jgi:hypothetical protein